MPNKHYILTTKFASCLNVLSEESKFQYLYRGQPDSGPFLDAALGSAKLEADFVVFDRVPASDTFKKLTAVYEYRGLEVDREAGLHHGQPKYELLLTRSTEFERPMSFGQDSRLWQTLETTHGKKTTTFYNAGRMLLPISDDDFETILSWSPETEFDDEISPGESKTEETGAGMGLRAESELHAHLADNLELIEPGLIPFDSDNYIEYRTDDGGRIDLLCKDSSDNVVVVELKRGKADDEVIGQLTRYMGWAREVIAPKGNVRGFIVANVVSKRLRRAASVVPDVTLVSYAVEFKLQRVE